MTTELLQTATTAQLASMVDRRQQTGRRAYDLGSDLQVVLARTFADLTRTLSSDIDIGKVARGVGQSCALLADASASVCFTDGQAKLNLVASTDERLHAFTQLEIDSDQGPVWCASQSGQPSIGLYSERKDVWGPIAAVARSLGYEQFWAFPFKTDEDARFGVLHLVSATPAVIGGLRTELISALCQSAATGLANRRTYESSVELSGQLQTALSTRIVIEQAKGFIAGKLGLGVEDAFQVMRTYARNHGHRLSDVAVDVVAGVIRPWQMAQPRTVRRPTF